MTHKLLFILICVLNSVLVIDAHVFDEKLFLDNLRDNPVIQQLYYPYMNRTIDLIDRLIEDSASSISDQCEKDLFRIRNGLLTKERWALLYYESNGFPKDGRLNGDYNNLGHYDQCLSIGKREMNATAKMDTKYCLISIITPEWTQMIQNDIFARHFSPLLESTKEMYKFNLGKVSAVCLPISCNTKSVLESVNRILLPLGLNATSQQHCSTSASNEPFTYTELIALTAFGCTTALCLLSEYFNENQFLSHFRISKNYSQVYDYDPNDLKTRSTDYLHGLKTLLVACSIMPHCFGVMFFQYPFLYSKIRYYHAGPFQIIFDRLLLFADQLFFFGGFFAMFSWFDSFKKINVTLYRYIFTRFLRIFTVSVMVILLVFLLPALSTGPYYRDLATKCTTNCMKNFWKNLLFINNRQSFLDICFMPTWYLSADFQLYLINYFLMYLLVKRPRIGLLLAGVELLAGSISVILYDYLNNIPYYYTFTSNMDSTFVFRLEEHYLPTFYHSNTFVFGILTAWAIKSKLKFKFLEKRINQHLISVLAVSTTLIATMAPEIWVSGGLNKYDLFIIVWSVMDKALICFSAFWCFYVLSLNYYPTVRKFFDLRCWIPFSQTSFSMIMCQFLYFYYSAGIERALFTFKLSNLLKEFLFTFIVTFLISNLTFVLFESPVTSVLMKLFDLSRRRDIIVDTKKPIEQDFNNLNNNNPDFKLQRLQKI